MTMSAPLCPYCNTPAQLQDSSRVYGRSYGAMWICSNYPRCDAYVGCHPGTDKPLGRLADKVLRAFKKAAHAYFDPLWMDAPALYDLPQKPREQKKAVARIRGRARGRAYAWLTDQLAIASEDCHIGMFDVETCKRVIEVSKGATARDIRKWAKTREAI